MYSQMKNWLKSIVSKKLSLELGTGTMVNHLEYNVRRGTKFPSGKVEIFANVIESKSKTSRFMVTSLVSKTLQQ